MTLCWFVIGLVVAVALALVSPAALAIAVAGGLAAWILRPPSATDADGAASATDANGAASATDLSVEDDALSTDSGVWSASDFALGAVKDKLVRPHSQPPAPPAGEVSAFRTIRATDGVERTDPLYERHGDASHFEQRMNRGHEANLRHHYTTGLNRAMHVARKELPMKDPNLIPLDPNEPVGCPRPLGKI